MKSIRIRLILAFILTLLLLAPCTSVMAQSVQEDTPENIEEFTGDTLAEEESSNMWGLVSEAGPIRYPIFAILFIGIFLISLKVFELFLDSKRATPLRNTPFKDFNLDQISNTLNRESEHMLSVVMSKLLNVFQTNNNADYLHDEISNYTKYRQDIFNSFRNRIDFLSDTAGALGLLGTVWGMFKVFSSGTLERDDILAGMGLALMSTLLGLVVSITLNFASTLTEGYFTKRLSKVTNKADELRFRLIELSENTFPNKKVKNKISNDDQPVEGEIGGQSTNNSSTFNQKNILTDAFQKRRESDTENSRYADSASHRPDKILLRNELKSSYRAGSEIDNIEVQLLDTRGKPLPSQELDIFLKEPGSINGKPGKATISTNKKGVAVFNWQLSGKTGNQAAGIRCSDSDYYNVKKEISVLVKPAFPRSIQILNNHQAAATGTAIPKPVSVVVKDKFDNPVPSVPVSLEVSMGDGSFPDGSQQTEMNTNDKGKIEFGFKLGDEPGFNAVDIHVVDSDLSQKFQAVGQEVTV